MHSFSAFSENWTIGSTFAPAIALVPKRRRDAIRILYRFCRTLDDIVDRPAPNSDPLSGLNWWRKELENCYNGIPATEFSVQLAKVIQEFGLPQIRFVEILSGMEQDVFRRRYETFAELQQYCQLVASAVGFLCIEIFGYRSSDTPQYARQLGIGLQLTNIIRDVFEDSLSDRIYIPLEDLDRFGYSENSFRNSVYNSDFVELMTFQSRRACEWIDRCSALLADEDRNTLLPAEVMRRSYRTVLTDLERSGFDVFTRTRYLAPHRAWTIAGIVWCSTHAHRLFSSANKSENRDVK